jgi:phosphatidylserine/phosphatidylglycerophosphate/cardiolipin synthase-like enzyme
MKYFFLIFLIFFLPPIDAKSTEKIIHPLESNIASDLTYRKSYNGNIFPLENQKYFDLLTIKIVEAKRSVNICMFLFKAWSNSKHSANQVIEELIRAAKRGVEVNVLLEKNGWSDDSLNQSNESTATKLREAGISVFFDRKDVTTHSKLIIIDERIVFIGSHNLTDSALQKNNETTIMVESEEMAAYFLSYIKSIETTR